jgi:hypothetical protein
MVYRLEFPHRPLLDRTSSHTGKESEHELDEKNCRDDSPQPKRIVSLLSVPPAPPRRDIFYLTNFVVPWLRP